MPPETPDRFAVLLVEDSRTFAMAVTASLARASGLNIDVQHVDTLADAIKHLDTEAPDVVLLDLGLPDSSGLGTFLAVREHAAGIPVVVLTALDDQEVAVSAVQAGAQDYLVKGRVSDVVASLRYAIERQKLTAQEASARAQYVAQVAHDLRAPLFAMAARAAAVLRSPVSRDEQVATFAESVQRSSKAVSGLADELLDVLGFALDAVRVDVTAVALGPTLEEIYEDLSPLAEETGISMVLRVDGDPGLVGADRRALVRVVSNLVSNSLKYTRKGGSVELRCASADGGAFISVSDTGQGIPPDQQARIFDPFYVVDGNTPGHGMRSTGLGLAITKSLVEAQGGRIDVQSVVGEGTTFSVWLPRP